MSSIHRIFPHRRGVSQYKPDDGRDIFPANPIFAESAIIDPDNTGDADQYDEPLSGDPLPLLYNVVYCSRAAAGLDEAAVDRIVASSRRNNPRQGITGLLVFGSGIFFQWLEGPRGPVSELMHTLSKDVRHDTLVRLNEEEEVRERLFAAWDMERVTAADIRDVLLDARANAEEKKNRAALDLLLKELDSGRLRGLEHSGSSGDV